jgi:bacteriocin biosynthesis cyclodehydratase domain-containing protein
MILKSGKTLKRYHLHPAVELVALSAGKLQLRAPFASITLTQGASVVHELAAASTPYDLDSLKADLSARHGPIGPKLLDLLVERRFLVSEFALQSLDGLGRLIESIGSRSERSDLPDLAEPILTLLGNGPLAEAVEIGIAGLGLTLIRSNSVSGPGHHIAITAGAESWFDTVNEEAMRLGRVVTYVSLSATALSVGPTVVPRQSACWACLVARRRGASTHVEEFDAARAARSSVVSAMAESAIVRGLVTFAVAHHVQALRAGVTAAAEPGRQAVWNLGTCERQDRPVLKLPRCPRCGRAGQAAPHAVRSIL